MQKRICDTSRCARILPSAGKSLHMRNMGRSQGLTGRPCWDRHTKKRGFASYLCYAKKSAKQKMCNV